MCVNLYSACVSTCTSATASIKPCSTDSGTAIGGDAERRFEK